MRKQTWDPAFGVPIILESGEETAASLMSLSGYVSCLIYDQLLSWVFPSSSATLCDAVRRYVS